MKSIKKQIEEVEDLFSEGNGFGDPDARRNAELKLQTLLSKQQLKTATQLNWVTWIMGIAAVIDVIITIIKICLNCS